MIDIIDVGKLPSLAKIEMSSIVTDDWLRSYLLSLYLKKPPKSYEHIIQEYYQQYDKFL